MKNLSSVQAVAVLPTNHSGSNIEGSQIVRFRIGKEHIRHFEFFDGDKKISVYHLYPTLADWVGKEVPDEINPRSHDDECLKGRVPEEIAKTIRTLPGEFYLANRGLTVLADSVKFSSESGYIEIILTDPEQMHGLADGATSDAVIHEIQKEVAGGRIFRTLKPEEIPFNLKQARVHVEIIVGVDSREKIGNLTRARNTSRQVKSWSLADFQGAYDWIQKELEREHGSFKGRVGYEENAGKEVTILDVLSYLTLFHKAYDEKGSKDKAPTIAYSSKGIMDQRLKDKKYEEGYKALAPILEGILRLHDHVYTQFEAAYEKVSGPNHKLGRRPGFIKKTHVLPLTGDAATYVIPSGVTFPLLASLRVLVQYDSKGKANWILNPLEFFNKHKADLVEVLMDQVDLLGGNPNTAGKKRAVYTTIYSRAKNLLTEDLK